MAIYALGDVEPTIDPTAYVHPDAVVIGEVDDRRRVVACGRARCCAATPAASSIGARTSIQDGTVVHTTPMTPTRVGDECVIGHLVHLEGCTIGNGVAGRLRRHRAQRRRGRGRGARRRRRARVRARWSCRAGRWRWACRPRSSSTPSTPSSTSRWAWRCTASAAAPTASSSAASTDRVLALLATPACEQRQNRGWATSASRAPPSHLVREAAVMPKPPIAPMKAARCGRRHVLVHALLRRPQLGDVVRGPATSRSARERVALARRLRAGGGHAGDGGGDEVVAPWRGRGRTSR